MKDESDRLLSKVQTDPNSGCWLWAGSLFHDGYAQFYSGGRMVRAHRRAYELFTGVIPDGFVVCHKCDTPSCVNPSHLFAATQRENLADSRKKNRLYKKISNEIAAAILEQVSCGASDKDVAKQYDISPALVWHLRKDKFRLREQLGR